MSFLRGVQRYEETTTSVLHEYGGENHLFDPTAPAQAVFGWDSCRRYGFGQNDHGVSSHFGTKTCTVVETPKRSTTYRSIGAVDTQKVVESIGTCSGHLGIPHVWLYWDLAAPGCSR